MRPVLSFWYLAPLFSYTCAKTIKTELVLTNAAVAPDGFNKTVIVVNGGSPGPLLTAKKGDSFNINVRNELSNNDLNTGTSIHWHGLHQHHTNAYDGTSFVTQCPIVPGKSFNYKFNVETQAGTFWYHSHYNLQYCDGLRGPLVIYDPDDPYLNLYDVDDESTIIMLSDWFHMNAADAFYSNPAGIHVNGMGRYFGGPNTNLSVTKVEQGKKYRIRLINMSCKAWITFSIDSHTFSVIEADGNLIVPVTADSITIHAGQRYSLVLEANQPPDNYWIRGLPLNFPSNFTNGLNSGILRYEGAAETEPQDRDVNLVNPLIEANLHSREGTMPPGLEFPGGADVSLQLVTSFNEKTVDHYINGVQYHPPDVPTLMQILSGTAGIAGLVNQGSVYSLPPNKSIEITFPAIFVPAPHPWHLHGHSFYVVRSAGSQRYNYVNPIIRDTVSMGNMSSHDNVTIRFSTDNAGPWFLHCHIDFHLERGMAVVMAEAPDQTAEEDPVDDGWKNLCPAWNQSLAKGTEM